jgi:2-polyprenyl-3-methyl-5-hydroxy-6-metoxy-1,4-benzoquinol methylase
VYDKSWLEGGYPKQSCWGCRFAADVIARVPFHTVLDAGAGNGFLIRQMRAHGKSAWGIELSRAVLESECPDLLEKGIVEQGSLTNLPYQDNQFDLVFSADVLEHIQPEEVDTVVRELIRVSKRHLFLSISLKGHTKVSDYDLIYAYILLKQPNATKAVARRRALWNWEGLRSRLGLEIKRV